MSSYKTIYDALAEDTALKAAEKLAEFGISVRHEDGAFKSLYEIIEELANYYFATDRYLENMVSIKDVEVEWN